MRDWHQRIDECAVELSAEVDIDVDVELEVDADVEGDADVDVDVDQDEDGDVDRNDAKEAGGCSVPRSGATDAGGVTGLLAGLALVALRRRRRSVSAGEK